ncbi:hypothetical protein V2J09_022609 [Rumex salicifolius]
MTTSAHKGDDLGSHGTGMWCSGSGQEDEHMDEGEEPPDTSPTGQQRRWQLLSKTHILDELMDLIFND